MTAGTEQGRVAGTEGARSLEVERKYDVEVGTRLPDWSGLPGVSSVSAGDERELDARYLDTADLALARAGAALRRRTGGPDAGWHLKGPRRGDGRLETAWPLGEDDTVPEGVAAAIAEWTRGRPLAPLARIENARTAYLLCDGRGGVVAEFVDDRVRTVNLRTGLAQRWREWELELGPAAPADEAGQAALFAAAEAVVRAAGGRPAASDSKLARALGA